MLSELGFTDTTYTHHPNGCLLQRDIYEDIQRISDPEWRAYLSQYRLVEKSGELQNLIDVVKEKVNEGTLNEFREGLNENLRLYGHHVTVFAKKC